MIWRNYGVLHAERVYSLSLQFSFADASCSTNNSPQTFGAVSLFVKIQIYSNDPLKPCLAAKSGLGLSVSKVLKHFRIVRHMTKFHVRPRQWKYEILSRIL